MRLVAPTKQLKFRPEIIHIELFDKPTTLCGRSSIDWLDKGKFEQPIPKKLCKKCKANLK